MKITVLSENTTKGPKVTPEFGLSLHIQCGSQSILFDAGSSGNFARNAQVLMSNPGNLDDTCKTFDFIERRNGSIEELIFLGGLARYSQDDRKTLAKVMARLRGEAE